MSDPTYILLCLRSIVPTYHCGHVPLNRALKSWCENVSLCPRIIVGTYHLTEHWKADVKTCHCAHVSLWARTIEPSIEKLMWKRVIVLMCHSLCPHPIEPNIEKLMTKCVICAHVSLCPHTVVPHIKNLTCLSTIEPTYHCTHVPLYLSVCLSVLKSGVRFGVGPHRSLTHKNLKWSIGEEPVK